MPFNSIELHFPPPSSVASRNHFYIPPTHPPLDDTSILQHIPLSTLTLLIDTDITQSKGQTLDPSSFVQAPTMADRRNPSGHGPTQARTQPIYAFTVTKLGQVVPNVPQASTPLATKPENENHATISSKHSIGHQHPTRATLAMDDKENHLGKIALQQQRPSFGKTGQPIHNGSMAKHLSKQSFGNTMIAPAPSKAPSRASSQLPPNATTELTAGTPTPTGRRDYKSNQQVVHEIKKFLPTFTFFFDSVDAHTQAILTKHLENLQAVSLSVPAYISCLSVQCIQKNSDY